MDPEATSTNEPTTIASSSPPHRGELAIMDATGHTLLEWSSNDLASIVVAQARFNDLRSKGFAGYRVGMDGETGEVLQAFDPLAEKIIMSPAMVGG